MVTISYGHGYLKDFDGNLYTVIGTYTGAAPNSTTTLTCIALIEADDYWNGYYIRGVDCINESVIGEIRLITDFDAATDLLTFRELPAAITADDTFQILQLQGAVTEDGQTLASPETLEDDYLHLEATVSAGNKIGYISIPDEAGATNIGESTITYPKIRFRYKTDTSKAKIVAVFSDATTQTILDQTLSSTMTCATVTLTTAKTLDHLRFHCDFDVGDVWYDFALVYKGDFTFPNGAFGVDGEDSNRDGNAYLAIPSRLTDVTQMLGSGNFEYNISCDLTIGIWKRTADAINGQVFYDIRHNSVDEPWQWLDTEREQMKVNLLPFRFTRAASATTLTDRLDLTFREYRLSNADNSQETYISRWGLNL